MDCWKCGQPGVPFTQTWKGKTYREEACGNPACPNYNVILTHNLQRAQERDPF